MTVTSTRGWKAPGEQQAVQMGKPRARELQPPKPHGCQVVAEQGCPSLSDLPVLLHTPGPAAARLSLGTWGGISRSL